MTQKLKKVQPIPLSRTLPGDNDRKEFKAGEIEELADSIREHGLVQPITVVPFEKDGEQWYRIVAGERRYRAHRHLGVETIEAIVRADLDADAESDVMLIENVNRVDLNPLDEAHAYEKRARGLEGTEAEKNTALAAKVGKSPQYIADRRSLLKLVEEVQFQLKGGAFPIGHALLMVKLDTNRQRMALSYYNKGGKMAQGLFAELCRQLYDAQVAEQQQGNSLFDMALWDNLASNTAAILNLRGKKAIVAVPKRDDLPPVRMEKVTESLAHVTERTIAEWMAAGKEAEAAALGAFYEGAVKLNYMKLPVSGEYTAKVVAKNG